MSILIFLIILLVLVIVHEFGHFSTAKLFGVRVDEFGFGFPPRLFGVKKGETIYSVNALPFGGFVKMYGETYGDAAADGPDATRSFVAKPKWQRAIVLLAGIVANFLLAWLFFSFGFISGLPTSTDSAIAGSNITDVHLTVVGVDKDSAAFSAGLKAGDKIVSVLSTGDTLADINPESFKAFVVAHPTSEIEIGYLRGDSEEPHSLGVTPRTDSAAGPLIGISMDEVGIAKLPFFRALWEGLKFDWTVARETVSGLYGLIRNALAGHGSLNDVTGPVGLVSIVGQVSKFGIAYILSFAALISVNLAVINLVPFPALDGGQLLFLLIERIKGKPINPKVANLINNIGFALLILLMLVVTYHDIRHL